MTQEIEGRDELRHLSVLMCISYAILLENVNDQTTARMGVIVSHRFYHASWIHTKKDAYPRPPAQMLNLLAFSRFISDRYHSCEGGEGKAVALHQRVPIVISTKRRVVGCCICTRKPAALNISRTSVALRKGAW